MTPTTEQALVSIYRSPRKREMYLYVPRQAGLDGLPHSLLEFFGKPVPVMDLLLKRERKLARADAGRVLDELMDRGYYLQLPPAPEGERLNPFADAGSRPGVGD